MSNDDQIHLDGPPIEPQQSARVWLMLAVGLVVGAAVGVLFSQSFSSGSTSGESLPAGSSTLATTPTTKTLAQVGDVESLQATIAKVEAELALAQEREFELRLELDPTVVATAVGCDEGFSNPFGGDGQANSLFVGPLWFFPADLLTFGAGVAPDQVFAGVERGDSVTMVVPASERDRYSLGWNPATWAGDQTVSSGERAVTLYACDSYPTVFTGGFFTTGAGCVPLDVYFGDDPQPARMIIPLGRTDCADGSMALVEPQPGPLPSVVGLTLRQARLAVRVVALVPEVNDGDPFVPDSMVWGQEPNDGGVHEPGTVVGLRTCQSGDDVVATYQERLDGAGVTLSEAWMAPSHDANLDSWWFVSAMVSGGVTDGQIATWGLPGFSGGADSNNTPNLSIPANAVAEGFGFGDLRFTSEGFGADDWLHLDGATASQRCVEASTGRGP